MLPGRSVRAALRGARGRVRGKGRRRALIPVAVVVAIGLLAAPVVHGERAQFGSLIVYLRGGISPRTLPRDHSTPVSVRLEAGIQTSESIPLPRVKKIRLELAYRGVLDTEGLAVCSRTRLRALDTRHAVAACGAAIVGTGSLYSRVFLPSQPPFGLQFQLLAFNGKTDKGQTAIWVLAYSPNPPVSFVLPFHVRRQSGPFGTVLVSVVPRNVGPWPHFAHFNMVVARHFRYLGHTHSYLRASCPLPPRFTSGLLSLARATFSIENRPDYNVETVRTCRAERPARVTPRNPKFRKSAELSR
jgi:hypothetical protein